MDGTNVKVFLDEWPSVDEYRAMKLDAERYRKLRGLHWSDGMLAVTSASNIRLGSDCPYGDRLDEVIDAIGAKPC